MRLIPGILVMHGLYYLIKVIPAWFRSLHLVNDEL